MTSKRTPESEDPRAVAAAEKCAEEGFYLKDSAAWQESVRDFLKGWQARDAAGPATREQGSAHELLKEARPFIERYHSLTSKVGPKELLAKIDALEQPPREQPEGEVKYFTAGGKFELQGSEIKNRQEEFPGHITYVPISALQSAVAEARLNGMIRVLECLLGHDEKQWRMFAEENLEICREELAKQSRPSQGPEGSAE